MQGWTTLDFCKRCGPASGCIDQTHPRYAAWELCSDTGERIATVQDFGAFYGTTIWGRTGARMTLEEAQEACVRMLETGEEWPRSG
jgi:hypothetical protein